MWIVKRIDEADFGCEERLPGEPIPVLVTIESDMGEVAQFECPENWLINQGIDEGDEWPEDIEAIDAEVDKLNKMSEWTRGYFQALEEIDDTDEE